MELKLFNAEDNFVVENMRIGDMTVEFVHDTKTGENYFNQAVLSDLFGITQQNIANHLNKYLKDSKDFTTNSSRIKIKLKTSNKGRRTAFYNFKAVTYLAFRVNTPEAMNVQNQISSILDTMFNVATGKTDLIFNNMEAII